MVAGSVSVWVEADTTDQVYEMIEKVIDALNDLNIPMSVSEDIDEQIPGT